ncbi:STN domain-containing protein [Spirosoma validum]|uniref:STN domain-containing protein n=1 Tax=Spirosoma validum TaxID=2771355 RepID=A0A927GDS2_9BACT|nr:STN domain-containing protein [Spirosoma validum]MBD2753866.1 STN domain-containing protein [Spirosoma validum]
MMSIRYFILLICLLMSTNLSAQSTPPLDRLISVDIRNSTVENALRQISQAGRFEFSYNPANIDGKAVVTLRLANTPVREVLNRVFQLRVTYKMRGNYVILLRADPPEAAPKSFLLDGYILDEQTGERITQASIFEKTTLASTVSNPFGYYRLRLPTNLPTVRLDVRKRAYVAETVIVRSRVSHSVSVRLSPQPLATSPVNATSSVSVLPVRVTEDTLRPAELLTSVAVEPPTPVVDSNPSQRTESAVERGRAGITKLFTSAQQAIHDINLNRDTLYRDWQVSFVPFIGTNHRLSGRISNRISVNALVGYSFGVRAFEVGGLMNLVRTNVNGFQAGGLANVVGGQVDGFQAGGLVNVVGGRVDGFQVGGLANVVANNVRGFQTAGLLNVTARSVKGVQVAGLVNYTQGNVNGWQVAGILNRARRVTSGLQIGLINIADSSGSVPIGLISYVGKGGYQRIEIGANEVNLLNVTFRTGIRRFYNILTAGYSFEREGSPQLSAGYGLGTAFRLSNSTLLNLEGTYHHLFYFDRTYSDNWNSQIRLSTLLEIKLSSHLSLAFGPSFNWYFSNDGYPRPFLQPDVTLFADRTDSYSSALHSGWIGFQIGLRYGVW